MKRILWLVALIVAGCASPDSGGVPAAVQRVDLTQQPWFPPVTAQQGFSCSQQAGLYYAFTAEWNRRAGLSAYAPGRRFSPYFAYSMVAGAESGRSHVVDGWITGREIGVPLLEDSPRYTNAVMHGYDRYLRAMQRRVKSWEILPVTTVAESGHAMGLLAAGHPLVCDFQIKGTVLRGLPAGVDAGGCGMFVQNWGRTGPGHAMVYAGCDPAMAIDANGDGRITTEEDITGDGRVTLADCERGAFLVINPWGGSWGDRGRAWVPVRLHGTGAWPWSRSVARVEPAESSPPALVLKLAMRAGDRQNVLVSVSDGRRSVQPWMFSHAPAQVSGSGLWESFTALRQPGPHLTRGALGGPGGGPLESAHDISALNPSGPFSVEIRAAGRGALSGMAAGASIVEYDRAGRIVRETPVKGLPAVLPPQGGVWSTGN